MSKEDSLAVEDAIKTFAYGQPKLLRYLAPEDAVIPSLPLDKIFRQIQPYAKLDQTKFLAEWVFADVRSSRRKIRFTVTSSYSCSAELQEGLERKDWTLVDDKWECLSSFSMDKNTKKFYKSYIFHKTKPDILPFASLEAEMEGESSRTILYWMKKASTKKEKKREYQNRITNSDPQRYGFSKRWKRSQQE